MVDEIKKGGDGGKPKEIVMEIILAEGRMSVNFPFLADKISTYGFLKLAEKTIDGFYAKNEKPKILRATQIPDFKIN